MRGTVEFIAHTFAHHMSTIDLTQARVRRELARIHSRHLAVPIVDVAAVLGYAPLNRWTFPMACEFAP